MLFALCAAASVPVVILLDLSVERAIVLAPLFVISFAAVVGVVLLWTRIAWEQIRDLRR
jgi:predicted membrane metal-binding protein